MELQNIFCLISGLHLEARILYCLCSISCFLQQIKTTPKWTGIQERISYFLTQIYCKTLFCKRIIHKQIFN